MTCRGCKGQRGAGWGIRWMLAGSAGGIERNLTVPYKHYALRSVLIAALLPAITAGLTNSEEPALVEQTLQAIRDCMARSPARKETGKNRRARPSIADIRDKRLLRICDSGLKIKVLSKISRKQEKFDEI